MKRNFLLPRCFKTIGWVLVGFTTLWFVLALFYESLNFDFNMISLYGGMSISSSGSEIGESASPWFTITGTTFLTTLFPLLLLTGLMFIAFSRNRIEDEYVSKIRESSFVWAMFVGYVIIVLGVLLVYGLLYIYLMLYIIYVFLILFICKFNYEMWKLKKSASYEE